MSDNKKRVSVNIGGSILTLITDESEDFVALVADTLNKKMRSIPKNSFRVSAVDAALLCAIDETSDRLKAEKRVRNLEAQLALYEADIAALKEQLEAKGTSSDSGPRTRSATISKESAELTPVLTRSGRLRNTSKTRNAHSPSAPQKLARKRSDT